MKKSSAQADAVDTLRILQTRISAISTDLGLPRPSSVRVATYSAAYDFAFLRPDDPWTWEHHCQVSHEVVKLAALDGLTVELTPCTMLGCISWCETHGYDAESPAGRAAYVSAVVG